ncbi:MAG: Y-family DNA polymerase [Gammaproteobacteria bacterium]
MRSLWLNIHLPRLPLEVYKATESEACPVVVWVGHGREQRVLLGNPVAQSLGIHPDMPMGAAYSLAEGLRVWARDEEAEKLALERIALWCGQFTSTISLSPPSDLLLEVAGSLFLFGSARSLLERVRGGVAGLGYRLHAALAPTPLAATLLARAGKEVCIEKTSALVAALAPLPLEVLRLTTDDLAKLEGLGLRTLGDWLRLPRKGLARRVGVSPLRMLDQALGKATDPRERFQPKPSFHSRVPLPAEVEDTQALLFAASRQLSELAAFLQVRCGGVQTLTWRLHHRNGDASSIALELRSPSRDPEHIRALLRQRLEGISLPAPVLALTLTTEAMRLLPGHTRCLFSDPDQEKEESLDGLFDRLKARLGSDAIQGLGILSDHRPERAWRACLPGQESSEACELKTRPLWLVPRPVALRVKSGQPLFRGRPLVITECERIESGWWDGQPVSRDYFVALDADGIRLWIYRELNGARRWFLHGLF